MESFSGPGLYVHVPFCKSRCHFCAFYLEIHRPASAALFVQALLCEIELYRRQRIFNGQPITSLYFGGGTPTTLSCLQLRSIVAAIRERFDLHVHAEVSIEAHPHTATPAVLAELADIGFNRISFGAESFDSSELVRMGRAVSSNATIKAVEAARRAGFANINLDLMYGLPGQTESGWWSSLQQAIALNPAHISCYALTLEEGTAFAGAVQNGRLAAPDADLQNRMEETAERVLAAAGFERYEISNYHRNGSMCRHNLLYWTDGTYLGLGPSAQSFLGNVRYGNVADLDQYARLLRQGILPQTDLDHLSPEKRAREAVVFGLRKVDGISIGSLSLMEQPGWSSTLQRLLDQRYLERSENMLRLSSMGRRYADEIAVQLL